MEQRWIQVTDHQVMAPRPTRLQSMSRIIKEVSNIRIVTDENAVSSIFRGNCRTVMPNGIKSRETTGQLMDDTSAVFCLEDNTPTVQQHVDVHALQRQGNSKISL
jgi:hypothetical protein